MSAEFRSSTKGPARGAELWGVEIDRSPAPVFDNPTGHPLQLGGLAFVLVLVFCLFGLLGWAYFSRPAPLGPELQTLESSPGANLPDAITLDAITSEINDPGISSSPAPPRTPSPPRQRYDQIQVLADIKRLSTGTDPAVVQRYLRALEQTNRHDWRDGRSQAFLKDVRRYVEQTQRHTALLRSPEYAANFDTPPQLIDFPLIYPEIGGAELSGVCTASLGVTETGQAVDVITLCQYSGEGERGWSRRGVAEGWTFKPATKNGEAVYFGDIEYSFRIGPYLDLK